VAGRIVPVVHPGAPSWARPELFTDWPERPTGASVPTAITANALVSADLLRGLEGPFDSDFGITGGSDSHMFRRATEAGARIVWAADAVVEDMIGPAHTNLRWVLQRAFRYGNSAAFIDRSVSRRWRAKCLAKAIVRLGGGAALVAVAAVRSRSRMVAAMRHVSMACGSILATAGYRYYEYRQPRRT
jgi:succinoglycan biosynthesis protein ExoM